MRFRKEDRSIIDAAVMSYHISDVVPVTLSRGRHLRPSGLTVSLPLVLTGATGAALLTSLHFKAILQPQIYFDKKKTEQESGYYVVSYLVYERCPRLAFWSPNFSGVSLLRRRCRGEKASEHGAK